MIYCKEVIDYIMELNKKYQEGVKLTPKELAIFTKMFLAETITKEEIMNLE